MTVTQAPADLTDTAPPTLDIRRLRARRLMGIGVLLVAVAAIAVASLALGAKPMPLDTVTQAFTSAEAGIDQRIVLELRLPRTVIGLAVGMALGVAGALMQAVTRNPLADPGLLGVNAGAAFAVVVGIWVFGVGSLLGLMWFAFVGAAASSVIVYALGSVGRGGATPVRLTLAGMALTALLVALTSAIALLDQHTLDQYRFWIVGSLAGRDLAVIAPVIVCIAIGVVLALVLAFPLNALALGDDAARALGTHVGAARAAAALAITLLCGAATAACGPIVFVGLVVPHVARLWFGPDQRWLIPASGLAGPLFLLGSDVVGRVIARPGELQVGIMTAAIGGPLFVTLVRRKRMAQL